MSDLFSKHLKKQSARAKEKLLESLGKANRTTDDIFEEHSANFFKQQKSAERMQKDVKNYLLCVKALAQASKTLHETVRDVYEPEWPHREHVLAMSQSCDSQWDEYQEKLNENVLIPLSNYNAHFVDLKTKIAKRGRKLVDYDSARHNTNTLKTSSKKGADDAKLQKTQTELLQAEKIFKDLNDELLDELPAFYDSRITFLVENLQALFNTENMFHAEAAKLNKQLCTELDSLGNALGSLRVPRPVVVKAPPSVVDSASAASTPSLQHSNKGRDSPSAVSRESDGDGLAAPAPVTVPGIYPRISDPSNGDPAKNPFDESDESGGDSRRSSKDELEPVESKPIAKERTIHAKTEQAAASVESPAKTTAESGKVESPSAEQKKTDVSKPKLLYKVRATHRYAAEDADELSFEAGDVIDVVVPDSPEDLDEGWLSGIKEADGAKGVFPANFTKPM